MVEQDSNGHDRYLFDTYFRSVVDSSSKRLELQAHRSLNAAEVRAYEQKFKALGKSSEYTRSQPPPAPRGLLALEDRQDRGGDKALQAVLAELEQAQIPIRAALKEC